MPDPLAVFIRSEKVCLNALKEQFHQYVRHLGDGWSSEGPPSATIAALAMLKFKIQVTEEVLARAEAEFPESFAPERAKEG